MLLAASVWLFRAYPDACKDTAAKGQDKRKHTIWYEGLEKKGEPSDGFRFNSGTEMLEPFTMRAGEKRDLWFELDYNRPGMTKDASVVVWGEKGEVVLTHTGGIPSMAFPTL